MDSGTNSKGSDHTVSRSAELFEDGVFDEGETLFVFPVKKRYLERITGSRGLEPNLYIALSDCH